MLWLSVRFSSHFNWRINVICPLLSGYESIALISFTFSGCTHLIQSACGCGSAFPLDKTCRLDLALPYHSMEKDLPPSQLIKCPSLFVLVCKSALYFFVCCLQLLSMEQPWTLVLDDPLANSFIAPATDDINDDHQLICKCSLFMIST